MSKTKIELKEPYRSKWKCGYVVINPEGRRTLILFNSHKERTSTQYARYLLSVKEGRFLNKTEHVDHIDNDKTNDSIDNLQIVTLQQNNIKTHKKPDLVLTCPVCKKVFTRSKTSLRGRMARAEQQTVCCSRICGGRYSHK